jgi:hypothetical protein
MSFEEKLDLILYKLDTICARLEIIEEETRKNTKVAEWSLKYTPTIDKIEKGLKNMMSPRLWFVRDISRTEEIEDAD